MDSQPLSNSQFSWRALCNVRVIPFALFIGLMIVESVFESLLPESAKQFGALWYPLRVIAVTAALLYFVRASPDYLPWLSGLTIKDVVIAVLAGVGILIMWIVIGPLVRMGDAPSRVSPIPQDQTLATLWLISRFFGTAIVVPIIEELFFRSFLMRRIDATDVDRLAPQSISLFAIAASSVVFSLEHKEVLAGFLAGLAFAYLYKRRGNLRDAIIAHGVTNALLFVFVLTQNRFDFWG